MLQIIVLLLTLFIIIPSTECFTSSSSSSKTSVITKSLKASYYGKGAEIWPPANENEPVRLQDSFPNGIIPKIINNDNNNNNSKTSSSTTITTTDVKEEPLHRWRRRIFPSTVIDKILRRAASIEENIEQKKLTKNYFLRTYIIIFICLCTTLISIKPLDILLVTFTYGYIIILKKLSNTVRNNDGITPLLPTLPPQGHVPYSISYPLGFKWTYSRNYERWLKLSIILSIPSLLFQEARRHTFFLCIQLLIEQYIKQYKILTTPLPIRILIPVMYNTIRIGYLYQWVMIENNNNITTISRILGICNITYWLINLFAFLLPIATIRYMRTHFFNVEAEQVVTRLGMEETIGL